MADDDEERESAKTEDGSERVDRVDRVDRV